MKKSKLKQHNTYAADEILVKEIITAVKYSLRHRKCGVRGFIHELFVSKPERARYERVRAFDTQRVNKTPYKALSMS